MGGSGSSGYDLPGTAWSGSGGGPAGPESDDPCSRLSFSAFVSSPDPAIVDGLSVGDVLDVVLTDSGGVPLVELRVGGGSVAGTLTTNLPQLLVCLEAGRAYVADVRSVSGGAVQVRVRAA